MAVSSMAGKLQLHRNDTTARTLAADTARRQRQASGSGVIATRSGRWSRSRRTAGPTCARSSAGQRPRTEQPGPAFRPRRRDCNRANRGVLASGATLILDGQPSIPSWRSANWRERCARVSAPGTAIAQSMTEFGWMSDGVTSVDSCDSWLARVRRVRPPRQRPMDSAAVSHASRGCRRTAAQSSPPAVPVAGHTHHIDYRFRRRLCRHHHWSTGDHLATPAARSAVMRNVLVECQWHRGGVVADEDRKERGAKDLADSGLLEEVCFRTAHRACPRRKHDLRHAQVEVRRKTSQATTPTRRRTAWRGGVCAALVLPP